MEINEKLLRQIIEDVLRDMKGSDKPVSFNAPAVSTAPIHPSVLPAISGLNSVDKRQAVGIVETWSVAACISAADRAVKGSNVTLVRVHMAFGIGGKCYMVVAGDVSDVNNAVTVASESAGEKGLLVYRSVIPRPHEAMWRQMVEG